jgi:hypothetical protein
MAVDIYTAIFVVLAAFIFFRLRKVLSVTKSSTEPKSNIPIENAIFNLVRDKYDRLNSNDKLDNDLLLKNLERLAKLRADSAISEEEYKTLKSRIVEKSTQEKARVDRAAAIKASKNEDAAASIVQESQFDRRFPRFDRPFAAAAKGLVQLTLVLFVGLFLILFFGHVLEHTDTSSVTSALSNIAAQFNTLRLPLTIQTNAPAIIITNNGDTRNEIVIQKVVANDRQECVYTAFLAPPPWRLRVGGSLTFIPSGGGLDCGLQKVVLVRVETDQGSGEYNIQYWLVGRNHRCVSFTRGGVSVVTG